MHVQVRSCLSSIEGAQEMTIRKCPLTVLNIFLLITLLLPLSHVRAEVPLSGFGDVGFEAIKGDQTSFKDHFFHGQIDLFLTKNLSEKVNFLAEIVFELNDANEAVLDPERLLIQYYASPWLRVGAGRFHTALGYWNEAYHHGSWLFAPIRRPSIFRLEDEGGILPVHLMGLEFRGEGGVGPGKFGYIANIGNGRGPQGDPPQIVNDSNTAKAINIQAYYLLPQFGNLRIGANAYIDTMPGFDDPEIAGTTKVAAGDEQIYGFHLLWQPGDFELLTENFLINHQYSSGEATSRVLGHYTQLSHRFAEKYVPFVRYDLIQAGDEQDAYTGIAGTTQVGTIGLRYDLSETSALKLEGSRQVGGSSPESRFAANWAFTW
jgi:hypothetical protein